MKKSTGIMIAILIAGLMLAVACASPGEVDIYYHPRESTAATTTTTTLAEEQVITTEQFSYPTQPQEQEPASITTLTTRAVELGWVYPFNFPGIAPALTHIPGGSDFYLILVNRNHALPCNFTRDFLRLEATGNGTQLHATAAQYFRAMQQAGRADGVELIARSGYRNTDQQQLFFETRIQRYRNEGHSHQAAVDMAARWIKPPRCSEHETGLAMDILSPGMQSLLQSFDQTAEFRWLQNNAHSFGFILRYPRGAEAITEVNYEPWHWRFVGIENATAIRSSGLVLEQWLERR